VLNTVLSGHELGPNAVAAADSRSSVPAVARQSSIRRRAAAGSPDLGPADKPSRGNVEGKPRRAPGRPGKTRR